MATISNKGVPVEPADVGSGGFVVQVAAVGRIAGLGRSDGGLADDEVFRGVGLVGNRRP